MSDLDYRTDLPAYSLSLAQIAASLAAGDIASRHARGGKVLSEDEATSWCIDNAPRLRTFPFFKSWEDHRLTFWVRIDEKTQSEIATLTHAKLNKWTLEHATEQHDDRIIFRIQAECHGDTLGSLAELLGSHLFIAIDGPDQKEMDLESTAEDVSDGEGSEEEGGGDD